MGTIDNSISIKMDMTELLQLMELIATSLITGLYITDFTVHDTNFIHTNVGRPFVWLVYESGTHIYAMDDPQDIENFIQVFDFYENNSTSDFCFYRYNGDKLFPVFPKVMRTWIDSELKKYSH